MKGGVQKEEGKWGKEKGREGEEKEEGKKKGRKERR